MPLPFAPPPKESKVYDDLKNIKVSDVTAAQMSSLKGDVYAQGVDGAEDEMRRLRLLGNVSNSASDSGPIPGTMEVISTGALTSTGEVTVFQPAAGFVYQVIAMSQDPEGSGSYRGIGTLNDGSGASGAVEIFDSSGTGSAEALTYDTPLFLTKEVYLVYNVITVDTSLELKIAVVRVR
jgi:hypothetical protein